MRSYGFISTLPYRRCSQQLHPPTTWFTGVLCRQKLSSGCGRQIWSPRVPVLGLLLRAGEWSAGLVFRCSGWSGFPDLF